MGRLMEMTTHNLVTLRNFRTSLDERGELLTDSGFRDVVDQALSVGLFTSARDFGGVCGVGEVQVRRWRRGVSAPPIPMRRTILRILKSATADRIREAEGERANADSD